PPGLFLPHQVIGDRVFGFVGGVRVLAAAGVEHDDAAFLALEDALGDGRRNDVVAPLDSYHRELSGGETTGHVLVHPDLPDLAPVEELVGRLTAFSLQPMTADDLADLGAQCPQLGLAPALAV